MSHPRGIPVPLFDRVLKSTRKEKLEAALRALAKPLVDAASGSLEGPDIEEILEKAGLIAWHTFDASNAEHQQLAEGFDFEIEDGDRFWRLTGFGKEILHG